MIYPEHALPMAPILSVKAVDTPKSSPSSRRTNITTFAHSTSSGGSTGTSCTRCARPGLLPLSLIIRGSSPRMTRKARAPLSPLSPPPPFSPRSSALASSSSPSARGSAPSEKAKALPLVPPQLRSLAYPFDCCIARPLSIRPRWPPAGRSSPIPPIASLPQGLQFLHDC